MSLKIVNRGLQFKSKENIIKVNLDFCLDEMEKEYRINIKLVQYFRVEMLGS